MAESFIGFYELDAAPSRGLTGELATRLGTATDAPGFIDGSLYVRSDTGSVAIVIQYDGGEQWVREGTPGTLLYAVDWRSRSADGHRYRHAGAVAGDGSSSSDSSFYVVQRFDTRPEAQAPLVTALLSYTERFAQPIHGFLRGDCYASLDGTRVVFIMPWAHEAALNALESTAGSLDAMQVHLRLAERHTYESFQRVSYLTAVAKEDGESPAQSAGAARRTPV
jgi:hypothetical protein